MGRHLLKALIAHGMVRLPERALMHAPNRRLLTEQGGVQLLLDSPLAPASRDDACSSVSVIAPAASELLFVDSGVRELHGLLSELFIQQHDGRAVEVVVLDANRDGIEQITAGLANRSEMQALHLVGQEQASGLRLGTSWLSWQSLLRYVGWISQWQTALRADGELWLYGPDWSCSASGHDLLEAIRDLVGVSRVRATREVRDVLRRDESAACDQEELHAVLPGRKELVFVDASLTHHPLVTELRLTKTDDERINLVELDPARDGVDQIAQCLSSHSNLDAVYVLSQAADRAFRWGNLWLQPGHLGRYATTLRSCRSAFAADAELLLIGVTQAPATLGRELLDELALLLGVEVVACLQPE
jgi:hypothetical protein